MVLADSFTTLLIGLLLGVTFGIVYGIKRIISLEEKIASMEKKILKKLK